MNIDEILPRVTRPGRYAGGEWNAAVKDWDSTSIRIAISYPDVYEIGMSNLGLAIVYDLINRNPNALAERVFAPWVDMEAELRGHRMPLFSLESRHALSDFDIIGFSLGYELTFTNLLNILKLAGIPLRSIERDLSHPIVIAGGTCAFNPEPVADFIDVIFVGEGEEAIPEFLGVFHAWKQAGRSSKEDLLREAARIPGIYVPRFYEVQYKRDGTVQSISPLVAEASYPVERRVVSALPEPLTRPVVPYLQAVHDRGAIEIQRGCCQGCRFCQAGMIYRPVRERDSDEIIQAVDGLVRNCGYEEVSLLSLSTGDYPDISTLLRTITQRHRESRLAVSFPSLRLDTFAAGVADAFQEGKKAGFTFAPEAGTERLRRVINKGMSEDCIMQAVEAAREHGWHNMKLYFMIGLPTENIEDVQGIVSLVQKIKNAGRGKLNVRVNVSTFVPKAHTPFQWVAQAGPEELSERHQVLKSGLRKLGIHLSWHAPEVSILEGALSRGDRRLSSVVQKAWELGSRFDAWSEQFKYELWQRAFSENKLRSEWYASRERAVEEVLPWSHIDTGVDARFLKREYGLSKTASETPACGSGRCNVCGLQEKEPSCQAKYQQLLARSEP